MNSIKQLAQRAFCDSEPTSDLETSHDKLVEARHVYQAEGLSLLNFVTFGLGLWAVLFGLSTFLGHKTRWQSPAYHTALLLPGAPESWATIIAVCGILLLVSLKVPRVWIINLANFLGFWWCFMFAVALLKESFVNEGISFTDAITYGLIGFVFAGRTMFFWRTRKSVRPVFTLEKTKSTALIDPATPEV